jgi:Arc/MetJ-type ribon-helix-helix transcriptional regulator
MRNIVNISMPAEMKKEVDAYVKEGNYASVSEFLRDVFRWWKKKQQSDKKAIDVILKAKKRLLLVGV